jgi:SAM-dependent methyltransferase
VGLLARLLPYRPLPGGRARLDAEWASGKWDFLRGLDHLPRLGVVASYCDALAPGGSVLEIGCGEGLLRERLLLCARYVGVDISAEAIKRASERADETTRFVQADASRFIPGEPFDVIAFNECLEWFSDPLGLLEHFEQFLTEGGAYLVSMYVDAQSRQVWRKLARRYKTCQQTEIRNADGDRWSIRVLK